VLLRTFCGQRNATKADGTNATHAITGPRRACLYFLERLGDLRVLRRHDTKGLTNASTLFFSARRVYEGPNSLAP
jgi:hypothetical protein